MAGLRSVLVAFLASASLVAAHPGEKFSAEEFAQHMAARDLAASQSKRLVETCATKPALRTRAAGRRAAVAQVLREKRGIVDKTILSKRDQVAAESWMTKCHDVTDTKHFGITTPESQIFTSNATTVLVPETVVGPYYVEGELIRRNITEGQAGVPVHLEIQFVDSATCSPVNNLLVDIWHSNATGVYSGIAVQDQGGLNSTFMRGVQLSDTDGVVQFDTIFPGHYTGRTPHIHVLSRLGGTVLPNNTYIGGTVNHIGQLYFDQELISAVESFYPYTSNAQMLTTNRADMLTADEATTVYDPFVDYVRLSSDANDGLLMWITIGINTTANYDSSASAAAHHYDTGGVANAGANGGMPPGGFPSGSMTGSFPFPTGTIPGGMPTGGFPVPVSTETAKPWGPCVGK